MNTIYYFSSKNGKDTNDGKTMETAFQNLECIKNVVLEPGDKVLLEAGSYFKNQSLQLSVSGNDEHRIIVGKYGDGNDPIIDANGMGIWYQNYGHEIDNPVHQWRGYVSSAILLYDCEHILIENIEIINNPTIIGESYNMPYKMSRTGIAVVAQNKGTLHNIELKNLFIHHVKGNVYDKHLNNGGIYCTVLKPEQENNDIPRFDNLFIHLCKVCDCSRWGIAVGYTYLFDKFLGIELEDDIVKTYGHTGVVIESNYLENIGGDGITPMYCYKPLVQYNVSKNIATEINDEVYQYDNGRQGKTAAAMWPWKCKDALFQFNEAYQTCLNQDGQAWDADSGDGTVYQYNYSYANGGGCVMFCLEESVNNIFRYNISVCDKDGILSPAENPDADIYNNIFIIDQNTPFIRNNMSGGHANIHDNLIYNMEKDSYTCDWHLQSEGLSYRDNIYYNCSSIPTEDKNAVTIPKEISIFEPLCGPKQAECEVHSRSCFEGYRSNNEIVKRVIEQIFINK